MKVVVLNGTGNVGKSFIAREVVYSNLKEPRKLFDFESYNMPNSVFKAIRVESYSRETFKEMLLNAEFIENVVIDVGSSNIMQFLEEMRRYHSALSDFDLFVVPTVVDAKQMTDSRNILRVLSMFNLQEKTRIIFNRNTRSSAVLENCKIANEAREMGFYIDSKLCISENSTVNDLTEARLTLDEVLSDQIDYKMASITASNHEERKLLYLRYLLTSSASSLSAECQEAWSKMISQQ